MRKWWRWPGGDSREEGQTAVAIPLRGIVHLQDVGDIGLTEGLFAGTRGESRRLEGFSLSFDSPVPGLAIQYMAHLQDTGDTQWVSEGQFVGTRGQSRRLEGFAIRLVGPAAPRYIVLYMAHLQDMGDTGFYQDSQFCGTRGQSRRLEGMLVRVLPRHLLMAQGIQPDRAAEVGEPAQIGAPEPGFNPGRAGERGLAEGCWPRPTRRQRRYLLIGWIAAIAGESNGGGVTTGPAQVTNAMVNFTPIGQENPEPDEQNPASYGGISGLDPSALDPTGTAFEFNWNGSTGS
jgi:Clostridial hydrophobic W